MKEEFLTFFIAMLPVSELRGAIPFGVHQGIVLWKVLLLSFFGNLLPVVPLSFLLNRIFNFLSRFEKGKKVTDWLVARTRSRSQVIAVYKTLGLIVFVGIPLPITGAWTGTLASIIFQLKFKYYITGVICGVIIASFVVTMLTLGVRTFF
jgi:uncharacterized membrane protein